MIWQACVCIVSIVLMKCQGCINVTKHRIIWHGSVFLLPASAFAQEIVNRPYCWVYTVSASRMSSDKWAMPRSKQRHSLPSQLVNEMQRAGQTSTQTAHQTPDRPCQNRIVLSNKFHYSRHVTQSFSDSYFSFCLWKQTPGKGGSQSSESEQPSADMNNESSEVTWI